MSSTTTQTGRREALKVKIPLSHTIRSYLALAVGIAVSFLLAEIYKDEINAYQYVPLEGLHHILWPIGASLLYLLIIYVIVPSIMKNREVMPCTTLKTVHNYLLTVYSFVSLIKIAAEIARFWNTDPNATFFWKLEKVYCDSANVHVKSPLYFWFHLYYLSKYYEMIDTLFICFTKKTPIFLHSYHHLITLWTIWMGMHEQFACQCVMICANLFIHVFMYYYYMQQTLGYTMWWKRYLTALQIVQFVIDELSILSWPVYIVVLGIPCAARWFSFFYAFGVASSFLFLFSKFYTKTYSTAPKKADNGKAL